MTDVLLDDIDGSYLTFDARVVKVVASDLIIDAPDRHRGGGPLRRALVHDQSDGLTLNFGGDYPGGVTIGGSLHAPGAVNVTGPLHTTGTVSLNGPLTTSGPVHLNGVAEVTPQAYNLIVHGGISFEVQVIAAHLGGPTKMTVILEQELSALRTLIADLTTRVAALEARPH
jgi:hypothetical protein